MKAGSVSVMALIAVLWASAARAQSVDVTGVEQAAQRGKMGLLMGTAGPPVVLGGAVMIFAGIDSNSAPTAIGGLVTAGVGSASFLVGAPLQAGSSMRGARLSGADNTLGKWAWGLWGASLLSSSAGQVIAESTGSYGASAITSGVLGVGGYIGSLTTGALQHRRNLAAVGLASTHPAPERFHVSLVPANNGLRVVGTF